MKHALDIPFALVEDLKERHKLTPLKGGIALYTGSPLLPEELKPYASQDYSYSRWVEDEQNALVLPPSKSATPHTLRRHQEEAAEAISLAYSADSSGFLLADARGCGKTLSVIEGVTLIAKASGFGAVGRAKVLVVTPRSKLEAWREDLYHYPKASAFCRFLLVDPGQLRRLLTAPPNARISHKSSTKAKQTAAHGVSTIPWDFVVFDDYPLLGTYPQDSHALEAVALAQLDKTYQRGRTPFTIFTSNHTSQDPLAYSLPAKVVSKALTATAREVPPKEWGAFLQRNNFFVSPQRGRLTWGKASTPPNPKHSLARDAALLRQALRSAPTVLHRTLPEVTGGHHVTYLGAPLSLSEGRRQAHRGAWATFAKAVGRNPAAADQALLHRLYRSTESLKVSEVVSLVAELVSGGESVYLRVEAGKLAEEYREKLRKKKVAAEVMTGRSPEEERELWTLFKARHVEALIVTATPALLSKDTSPAKSGFSPVVVLPSPLAEDHHNELRMLFKDAQDPKVYLPYLPRTHEAVVVENMVNYSHQVKRLNHGKMITTTLRLLKKLVATQGRNSY